METLPRFDEPANALLQEEDQKKRAKPGPTDERQQRFCYASLKVSTQSAKLTDWGFYTIRTASRKLEGVNYRRVTIRDTTENRIYTDERKKKNAAAEIEKSRD